MAGVDSIIDVLLRLRGAPAFAAQAALADKAIGKLGGTATGTSAKWKKTGADMRSFGSTMSTAVTLPILAAAGVSVALASKFETQMANLGAVTGASGKQLDLFRKQALKLGAETKFSAREAAQAQVELAKGGLDAATILGGGLKGALALAAAGEMDLKEAASTTANALTLFGLKGSYATRIADQMAQAANSTTADVSDFGFALKQSGGVARMAGLSFTETMTALEALAATGLKGSDAGTSLKTSLIQLAKPTSRQADLAKELGLNFFDAQGRMKDMSQISTMLRSKLGDMTREQRTATLATLAGTDGVRTLNALYQLGPKRLDAFRAGLQKNGVAADVARKKQATLAGQLEQLQGSLETLAIVIGTTLIPPLTDLAKTVTPVIADLAQKFQGLPKPVQSAVVGFVLLLAVIGPLVFMAGMMVTAFGSIGAVVGGLSVTAIVVIAAIAAVIGVFTGLWFVLNSKLNPALKVVAIGIGLLISPFAAVAAVLVYLAVKTQFFQSIWAGFKAVWMAAGVAIRAVATAIVAVWRALVAAATWSFNALKAVFSRLKSVLLIVYAPYVLLAAVIIRFWRTVFAVTKWAVTNTAKLVATVWRAIFPRMVAPVNAAVTLIKRLIGVTLRAVWSRMSGPATTAVNAIKTVIKGLESQVRLSFTAVEKIVSTAVSVFNDLLGVIKDVAGAVDSLMSAGGGLVSKAFNKISGGLAGGGTMPIGSTWFVGEQGPELAQATPSGTRITPLSGGLASGFAAGGGGDVNITVQSLLDGRLVAESTYRHAAKKAARA